MLKHALPKNVSGGETVTLAEADHGLGKKDELAAALKLHAAAQGLEYTAPIASPATSEEGGTGNAIDIPLQKMVLGCWENNLHTFYSTEDPQKRDAQAIADKAVRDTLHELFPAEAVLFVPPDEFHRVHAELQKAAEQMVKEVQSLARRHSKKLPIHEDMIRRNLHRDISTKKFRDRHNALFHRPDNPLSASDTGIPGGASGPAWQYYRRA